MTLTARPRLLIRFAVLAALALCGIVLALSSTGTPPVGAQDGSAPAKPTGVVATATHDSVALAWDDPGDASITHYQIFRRDRDVHDAGEFVTIEENTGSAARSYTDDTVEPETRYVYRVKAVNQHGASTWSNFVRADTPAAPDPADLAPSGLEVSLVENRVTLTWDAPASDAASVTGYEVLRRRPNDGEAALTTLVADTGNAETGYTDDTANEPGVSYTYRVKALRDGEQSKVSNYARIDLPDDYAQDTPEPQEEAQNTPATGAPTISGDAYVGETLTAEVSAIDDPDGLGNPGYGYQWVRYDETTDNDITGANSSTYTLVEDDAGNAVKVRVSFTDDGGNPEELTSGATATVLPAPKVTSIEGEAPVAAFQEATVALVSNMNQTTSGSANPTLQDQAQAFTTGTNSFGYTLESVQTRYSVGGSTIFPTHTVSIWTESSNSPGSSLGTLTNPDPVVNGVNTYTATDGISLSANTTYFIVMDNSPNAGDGGSIFLTASDSEDSGAASGWSIGDGGVYRDHDSTGSWETSDDSLKIRIRGTVPIPTEVPPDWSLIPSGLGPGDSFRLLFVSSTTRNAMSSSIEDYDTHVQNAAADGHADIQAYSAQFEALGSTEAVDARDNTGTTGTGVPIYYLNGAKVADDYGEFYDGGWDSNLPRTEAGDTFSSTTIEVWTGSGGDGREKSRTVGTEQSVALGASGGFSEVGRADISSQSLSKESSGQGGLLGLYGLSPVFQVADQAIWSATLTVEEFTISPDTYLGYSNTGTGVGDLDPLTFSHDGNEITVNNLWYIVGGLLNFQISQELGGEGFLLRLDETLLQLGEPTGDPPEYEFSDHGLSWSDGDTVEVRLIPNQAPTGEPVITGTARVGEFLTVDTSNIGDPDGIINPTFSYQWIANDGTDDSDISGARMSRFLLQAKHLGQTIKVRVTFTDDNDYTETLESAATAAVAGPPVTVVPLDWALIPSGLSPGDQFRLLFISSATRTAEATDIAQYNAWVQGLAATHGHTDIQDYSSTFRVVGSTADVDARDNTATAYTSDDKGVPIYWLNGNKAADQYEDFYDGSWDEEATMRTEAGASNSSPSVLTGSSHNGTENIASNVSYALGKTNVGLGKPNSFSMGAGPIGGESFDVKVVPYPFYGLSGVFSVSPPGEILYSATLTVEEYTFGLDTYLGYDSDGDHGSLHPVSFSYAGSSVALYELYYSVGGDLVLDINAPSLLGSGSFNLYLDGAAFLIEDPASDSDGEFEFSDHGLSWTNGQIVRVWLTENREPKLTISGTTQVGQTLTATIDEPDGLPPSDQITYQWIRVDGNTESDISGETGSTYTLVDADEGKTIKVEASYTDNANFAESLTSAATTAVVAGKAALVSNLGQAAHSAGVSATDSQDLAQGFTTGSRSGGYTLGSVELDVTGFTGTASDVTVSIYSESGNDPNTAVHVLTTPASISGLTTFTAPSNANLAADTQYYVVITTAGEDVTLSRTDSTADDSGGAAGWSIQDSGRINETGWTSTTRPLRISIKGLATASDDATLSDLVLNDGTNDLTLTPTFASGMTSYTAEVAYTIDQLTLTPTKSDSNADVEYLDDDDKIIADADTVTTGQQVDLKEGANTIKVKVTAEDYVATETYEVTVTRETARAHCDDTEVWCETMVVGSVGAVMGWDEPGLVVGGALSAGDEDFDYGMHTYDFTSIFLSGSTLSIQFNAGSTGDLESRRTRDKLVFTVDGQEFNLGAGELHSNGRGVT